MGARRQSSVMLPSFLLIASAMVVFFNLIAGPLPDTFVGQKSPAKLSIGGNNLAESSRRTPEVAMHLFDPTWTPDKNTREQKLKEKQDADERERLTVGAAIFLALVLLAKQSG